MKSAEARLLAMGIFHTTAMRKRAFTSGSWGWGSSGSQKENEEVNFVIYDLRSDLLVAARGPLLSLVILKPSSCSRIFPVVPVANI